MHPILSILTIFLAAMIFVPTNGLAVEPAGPKHEKWNLVWSDEFDNPGPPDPAKWDYEVGWVRNQESQYYTKGRAENARVEDGVLVIEGRKESFKPEKGPEASYTSASLMTRNKASWKYGRIEVRAKLPRGKGTWPAIWMLGTAYGNDADWPMCGEIDIMEHVGKQPDHIYGTIHHGTQENRTEDQGKFSAADFSGDFHVYAIEWYEDRIDFFVDDTRYHSAKLDPSGPGEDNRFRQPFYLILNLAIGGSWGGWEIDDSVFPARYLIDYVRVYQQRADADAVAR